MNEHPKFLIGASIPRSGHHFLQSILKQVLGDQMYYCEFYNPKDCCKQIPCTRRGDFGYIFQKSHDRDMEVPQTIADAIYIVQYRHPVPEALSDRELESKDRLAGANLGYRASREHYLQWLASKAIYYRRFHNKWFAKQIPSGIYLEYDALAASPTDSVEQIVRAAAGHADRSQIEAVVEEIKFIRAGAGARSPRVFRPRVVEESLYFDADLLGAFEDYVLSRCPNFGYSRMLNGRYEGHAIQGLIIAFDESEPIPNGYDDRLGAAISLSGEHPELMIRVAQRNLRDGNAQAAVDGLERVVRANPSYLRPYQLLLTACKALNAPPSVNLFTGDALVTLSAQPDVLLEVGNILLHQGQIVNAVAALSIAVTLCPENPKAHRLIARALLKAGKLREALGQAEAALKMDPGHAATAQLISTIHLRLGHSPAGGGQGP